MNGLRPCDGVCCRDREDGPWMIPTDNFDGDHEEGIPPDAYAEVESINS